MAWSATFAFLVIDRQGLFLRAERVRFNVHSPRQPERRPVLDLIDTHCHLEATAFDEDLDTVLAHARDNGVTGIVAVGVSPGDFAAQGRALCQARATGVSAWGAFGT
ncbi:MAG: TatD family hydrolase, partial [Guyparkeria sp.]